jgi:glycosyltransferase involved in cell wall biosynthesis
MMQRILAVTNLYADPWDATRGMFNQQQFDRLGHEVDLHILVPVPWTTVMRHPLAWRRLRRAAMAARHQVDYVIFWYPPGLLRSLHSACLFLSLLLQRAPTVLGGNWDCILASWGFPDAVAVAALAKLTGTPYITKVHGTDINTYTRERSRRWQIRWAMNGARRVIAVSQALAQRLADIGVNVHRTSVLYNGVELNRFHPADGAQARQALGFGEHDRVLLFVGNLKADKGCVEMLEAFANLALLKPELQLAFVGEGPMRAPLQARCAALGLQARVRWVGRQPHAALPQWYAAAELLCLPSHAEGTPNVVLEAMACGLPVVATQVGGISEVLPHFAGLTVPLGDGNALQAALAAALAGEWDRERIVAHARRFDWSDNVRKLRALLEEAAA